MGSYLPWYFNNSTALPINASSEDLVELANHDTLINIFDYQFIHSFYSLDEQYGSGIHSSFFENIKPILKELNCSFLLRIKANLKTLYEGSQDKQSIYYHIDTKIDCTTAIFYINTNNGYTIFKDTEEKVDCVANRLVKFDTKLEHAGISSNNSKQRIVINFNYIE